MSIKKQNMSARALTARSGLELAQTQWYYVYEIPMKTAQKFKKFFRIFRYTKFGCHIGNLRDSTVVSVTNTSDRQQRDSRENTQTTDRAPLGKDVVENVHTIKECTYLYFLTYQFLLLSNNSERKSLQSHQNPMVSRDERFNRNL